MLAALEVGNKTTCICLIPILAAFRLMTTALAWLLPLPVFFRSYLWLFLREAWCWVTNSKETGEKWLPVILNVLDWLCSLISLNCGPSSQGILINHSFLSLNKRYDLEFVKKQTKQYTVLLVCTWFTAYLTFDLVTHHDCGHYWEWPQVSTVPNLAFNFVTWRN